MRIRILILAVLLAASAHLASAQNVIKLFDAVPIGAGQNGIEVVFGSKQVYLSCPSGAFEATLSGRNGGNLVVDNYIMLNGENVCPNGNCFDSATVDPMLFVGDSVDTSYVGVPPLNVSGKISGSGLYTFQMMDYGYTLGSSEVYLNTSCSVFSTATQICHRNMGNAAPRTLTVGPSAIGAHLAHGDTAGPCTE